MAGEKTQEIPLPQARTYLLSVWREAHFLAQVFLGLLPAPGQKETRFLPDDARLMLDTLERLWSLVEPLLPEKERLEASIQMSSLRLMYAQKTQPQEGKS